MKLRVQYTAQLRTAVGLAEEVMELPEGSRLDDLLQLTAARNQEARPHLLCEKGQTQPSLLMIVNGAAIPAQQAATTVLSEGDTVALLPPIAGG
jgi:molybdopterin synthase sulfur carrier subunit